jgi:hypothetical protein
MQSVLVCGGVAGLAVEISNPAGCLFSPPFCGNETRTEISNGRGMITMLIGQYAI